MAAEDGAPQEHLIFLLAAAAEARRHDLFGLLRRAEARAPGRPRIGTSRLPAQNIVDLAQSPTLAFPGATLESIAMRLGRARVEGHWLGLLGTMGPLPLHLTEYAWFERRYSRQRPFASFLDLLAGRSLQLFYRAWADASPAASADRPADDRFASFLAALTGAGLGVRGDATFPTRARLYYAGLYSTRRSAAGLQDALSDLVGGPVELTEYVPLMRDIEVEDQSRLGRPHPLGVETVAGRRTYTVSDAFRITLHADSFRAYESFLPGQRRFQVIVEAISAFAPGHLEWDLALEIDAAEIRPAHLDGRARLGWTSWMTPDPGGGPRRDARLGREARRIARREKKKERTR
jgi:type VI secretion system protein ImpH